MNVLVLEGLPQVSGQLGGANLLGEVGATPITDIWAQAWVVLSSIFFDSTYVFQCVEQKPLHLLSVFDVLNKKHKALNIQSKFSASCSQH